MLPCIRKKLLVEGFVDVKNRNATNECYLLHRGRGDRGIVQKIHEKVKTRKIFFICKKVRYSQKETREQRFKRQEKINDMYGKNKRK